MSALIIVRASTNPIITTASVPAATVGTPYSFTFSVQGGTPPYVWLLTSAAENWGDWASGLQPIPSGGYSLPSGTISGTPEQADSDQWGISVTDANNKSASASFSITINAQAP